MTEPIVIITQREFTRILCWAVAIIVANFVVGVALAWWLIPGE